MWWGRMRTLPNKPFKFAPMKKTRFAQRKKEIAPNCLTFLETRPGWLELERALYFRASRLLGLSESSPSLIKLRCLNETSLLSLKLTLGFIWARLITDSWETLEPLWAFNKACKLWAVLSRLVPRSTLITRRLFWIIGIYRWKYRTSNSLLKLGFRRKVSLPQCINVKNG